jgi:hypothetical protein
MLEGEAKQADLPGAKSTKPVLIRRQENHGGK